MKTTRLDLSEIKAKAEKAMNPQYDEKGKLKYPIDGKVLLSVTDTGILRDIQDKQFNDCNSIMYILGVVFVEHGQVYTFGVDFDGELWEHWQFIGLT